MPSDAHAESRRKRLFAAYIRSACPGRQAQRKMGARCALILGLAERVYHSQQLLTLHGLYSLFLLLSPLWLLCGSSGLLCKLAHPVHLKMHRCVIPLSPPQKKRAAQAPFLWRREWDSNPRSPLWGLTRFRVVRVQPGSAISPASVAFQ